MKKVVTIFFLVSVSFSLKSQNLVPNGDFEQYITCPSGPYQFYSVATWINPSTNIPGTSGTPDYFNQCCLPPGTMGVPQNLSGYQPAYSGGAYAGIYVWHKSFVDYREFIEVPLISPLIANNCYHFEMYVSLANISKYTTDALGAYFSDTVVTGINNYYPLPFTPQINNNSGFITDTSGWTLVSGDFTAAGGESYLIIGNFKNDMFTDTVLFQNGGNNVSFIFIDDVSLTFCTGINEQNIIDKIDVFPTITRGKVTVRINDYKNIEQSKIEVYDVTGKLLFSKENLSEVTSIDLTAQRSGNYFLRIFIDNKSTQWKVVKTY